eukprot:4284494-Lingulodinium_polyedra.AAC.1
MRCYGRCKCGGKRQRTKNGNPGQHMNTTHNLKYDTTIGQTRCIRCARMVRGIRGARATPKMRTM